MAPTECIPARRTAAFGWRIPVRAFLTASSLYHFRVPYPMGFYTRGMDGRIDDPKAGWKGRGIWATYGEAPVWHQEGGDQGAGPELVHFQLRPDPLAH